MHKLFGNIWRKMRRNNRGQSATEYMLIIAIVVLGLVAAASHLIPKFQSGVKELGSNIEETLKTKHTMCVGSDCP